MSKNLQSGSCIRISQFSTIARSSVCARYFTNHDKTSYRLASEKLWYDVVAFCVCLLCCWHAPNNHFYQLRIRRSNSIRNDLSCLQFQSADCDESHLFEVEFYAC